MNGAGGEEPPLFSIVIPTFDRLEVLREVATGKPYRDIAAELFISHRTVQNHVHNVLRKLQLHNRVELTLYAIDQGWHDPSA